MMMIGGLGLPEKIEEGGGKAQQTEHINGGHLVGEEDKEEEEK